MHMPPSMPVRGTGKAQPPRLLLDLSTSLAWQGKHAVGIVRAEREIAVRLLDCAELCVIPVVYRDHQLRAVEPEFARRLVTATPERAEAQAPGDAAPGGGAQSGADPGNARSLLRRIIGPVAGLARLIARNLVLLVPERSREEARLSLIYARQALRHLLYRPVAQAPAAAVAPAEPVAANDPGPDLALVVHPGPADILFLGGLGWDVIDWRRLSSLRGANGMRIVSVMYDLIPIKFPEFLGAPSSYYFNYFLHVIDNCERILCISRCTRADLSEFIEDNHRRPVPTDILYLGANLPAVSDGTEVPDAAVRERLRRGRFALTVGTFEVRKNYALLIDLWEELLPDPGFDLDLVIVGMPGWCAEDTIARLEASPAYGSRIFWFKRLSDAGLSWLYENCHVFMFPSLYEGWGLPVVEALQHGRPVIASSAATIIDPDDRAGWRDAVIAIARAPRQTVETGPLPDWDDTAETVKRCVLDMMRTGAAAA
jgi:glycosyltransferase involved in cell wall biosynthesis